MFTDGFKEAKSSSGLLFQDSKKGMTARAERECGLLEKNTKPMLLPDKKRLKTSKKKKIGGGAGFGKQAGPVLTAAQQADALRLETVREEGVTIVPGVLSKDSAATLLECVSDELARSYAAVDRDPSTSLGRFNVPAETFDPTRGYLLLPLRDEASVEKGEPKGPLVSALSELLAPGAPLNELFSATCGGDAAEFYDLVGLRTEAGASRQPIHADTPWQKTPGLFCAFIALHDVRYSQGTTVFLPGTHKQTKDRKAFDNGLYDEAARDEMLSSV